MALRPKLAKNWGGNKMTCKHCEFIKNIFGKVLELPDSTNREYWLMTEVFVYLHGKDYCEESRLSKMTEHLCDSCKNSFPECEAKQ